MEPDEEITRPAGTFSRREFLGAAGGVATAAAAAGLPSLAREAGAVFGPRGETEAPAALPGLPLASSGASRRDQAAAIRHAAADFNHALPVPPHPANGDEAAYPQRIGNYSKGLPHDGAGEVDPTAYAALLAATQSGSAEAYEAISLGCPIPAEQRKLVNPMAGKAFDLQGTDSHQLFMPPAPTFASAWQAGEAAELYWMALLRDIGFSDYATDAGALAACADLSALSDFRGPKSAGQVTPATLFRDAFPGCLTGPYLSQFLLKSAPFGAEYVERRMRTLLPATDHVTDFAEWLSIQNGCRPSAAAAFDPVRRYIRNGRDLAEWVHVDVLFQAYFEAMLTLLHPPHPSDPAASGIGAPLSPTNPYHDSLTQEGFGTFGGPHVATLVCEPSTRALKAVWFQKWYVHRRLRPEAFGGRVHRRLTGGASYPIHPDLTNSNALAAVFSRFGSYLLPQAFPEGSPLHPAYGSGHATVAGACITMLKAMFDESFVIPDPVVPTPDGLALQPYVGPDLTVGGELNKLASNIATGRNLAGIHWRTDGNEGIELGEAVAISILRDQAGTFKDEFSGFTLTRVDGTRVTITGDGPAGEDDEDEDEDDESHG